MSWPTCLNCRYGDPDSVCRFTPRHPYRRAAADLARDGSCGYWHSPEGQTRRQRCREINRRLDGTRPPTRSETIRRGLAELLDGVL
jgi:hypothetical protein